MCSWCWAFRPVWQEITRRLPRHIRVKLLLGGLAADTEQVMPTDMQNKIRHIWQTIQQEVPGTVFNFDFWERCTPRRSTYPACRAVIATGWQAPEKTAAMVLAIQKAYYLQARNPSDEKTLLALAVATGLDVSRFQLDLNAQATRQQLQQEINSARGMGVHSFPSLVLNKNKAFQIIPFNYNDPAVTLRAIAQPLSLPNC